MEKLQVASEELYQQSEELRQQNEELAITRAMVEAEKQRYQKLFEEAPDGYLLTDTQGTIWEANRAAATLLNVRQQYLVGKPLVIFFTEEMHQEFYSKLNQINQIERVQEWEVRLISRNRTPFDAALTMATVCDQQGLPVALRLCMRNITSRKQAEEKIRTMHAELSQRVVFEATLKRITDKVRDSLDQSQILQTAVQELAQGLEVIRCNMAWYNADQTSATVCHEYTFMDSFQSRVLPMAYLPDVFHQLLLGQHFQFCYIDAKPSWLQFTILACPIFDDQGVLGDLWLFKQKHQAFNELEIRLVQLVANQCAIALRQARLYQATLKQVEELEQLNSLKDDFLSTISHELRTPMTNMKMAIHLLQLASAPEERERYLKVLKAECAREVELINDLLDLQRLEARSYHTSLETVSLQDWLPSIIEPFRSRTQSHQQTLQVNFSPDLPPLLCDRASLGRVLAELLNNACKYTPAGGEITLSIRYDPNPPAMILSSTSVTIFSIRNEAEIPAHELPRIFEKFCRVPNANPWKQSGTGLGLALVQKIVEQLQGTILVESSFGWTTFTVQLPNKP